MKDDTYNIDDVTINTLDYGKLAIDTLTSSMIGPYPSYNVGIGAVGANGSNGTYYTTNTGANWGSIGTSTSQPSIQVKGDAVFEGKVMINGRNISEFMEAISKRLSILVPDPAKLEHFEALKKAYDHYKLLEALCELPTEPKE